MTKREFLETIRKGISSLSEEDIGKSIRYYSEMIDDRIEDGIPEEEAVAAMGNPESVIAEILSEASEASDSVAEESNEEKTAKKGFKYGWIIASAIVLSLLVAASAMLMPLIKAGFNKNAIVSGWGYFDVDGDTSAISQFHSIRIAETFSDVIIERSETEDCYVRFTSIEGIHRFYNIGNDGVLYITCVDDRNWFQKMGSVWYGDSSLTLYLPRDMYNNLYIEAGSADVTVVDDLTFGYAEIKTGSGDIDFRSDIADTPAKLTSRSGDISVSYIERGGFVIETSSGDVDIKKVYTCPYKEIKGTADELSVLSEYFGADKEISVKTASGDISIDGARAVDILLETASGEIKLADVYNYVNIQTETTSGDIEAQNVVSCIGISFKATSGDIEFKGIDSYSQMNLSTTSGDIDGYINSKRYFSIQTSSGSVNVPANDVSGPLYHCSVTTVSGDIDIRTPE